MAGATAVSGTRAHLVATLLSLLAVLFLANAPIQSTLMAVGADDGGVLCAVHTDKGDQHSPVDRQAACAACTVCHLGWVAVVPQAATVATSAVESPVVRALRPAILNPRGPPILAPNARGPPTLS